MKKTLSIMITAVMISGPAGLPAAAAPRLPAALQTEAGSDMLMQVGYHGHGGHRARGHHGHGYRGHGYGHHGYSHHGYRHHGYGHYAYRHHGYYDDGYGYGYHHHYAAPFYFGFSFGPTVCFGGGYGFYGCGW